MIEILLGSHTTHQDNLRPAEDGCVCKNSGSLTAILKASGTSTMNGRLQG